LGNFEEVMINGNSRYVIYISIVLYLVLNKGRFALIQKVAFQGHQWHFYIDTLIYKKVVTQEIVLPYSCEHQHLKFRSPPCLNISTAMGLSAMFTFQLDNTNRQTLPAPHCRNGSCRYVRALAFSDCFL
jgi:hypothetical protein